MGLRFFSPKVKVPGVRNPFSVWGIFIFLAAEKLTFLGGV